MDEYFLDFVSERFCYYFSMRPATNLIATQGTPPPAMPGQDQRLVDVRIRLCAAAAKTRCAVRAQKAVNLSRKSDRERKRTLRVHQKQL